MQKGLLLVKMLAALAEQQAGISEAHVWKLAGQTLNQITYNTFEANFLVREMGAYKKWFVRTHLSLIFWEHKVDKNLSIQTNPSVWIHFSLSFLTAREYIFIKSQDWRGFLFLIEDNERNNKGKTNNSQATLRKRKDREGHLGGSVS